MSDLSKLSVKALCSLLLAAVSCAAGAVVGLFDIAGTVAASLGFAAGGLILALHSLREIKNSKDRLWGRRWAIAAIGFSLLGVFISLVLVPEINTFREQRDRTTSRSICIK